MGYRLRMGLPVVKAADPVLVIGGEPLLAERCLKHL